MVLIDFIALVTFFPPDYLCYIPRLIEECCHPDCVGRPTFSEIIVRLEKVVVKCSKHGWWKDAFKLPWYASAKNSPVMSFFSEGQHLLI